MHAKLLPKQPTLDNHVQRLVGLFLTFKPSYLHLTLMHRHTDCCKLLLCELFDFDGFCPVAPCHRAGVAKLTEGIAAGHRRSSLRSSN